MVRSKTRVALTILGLLTAAVIVYQWWTSGTPSIQFSLAPDGTRGDIDVDYRSSAFPIMLLNGDLTASNSDVRAGNNDERHNGHWQGLAN